MRSTCSPHVWESYPRRTPRVSATGADFREKADVQSPDQVTGPPPRGGIFSPGGGPDPRLRQDLSPLFLYFRVSAIFDRDRVARPCDMCPGRLTRAAPSARWPSSPTAAARSPSPPRGLWSGMRPPAGACTSSTARLGKSWKFARIRLGVGQVGPLSELSRFIYLCPESARFDPCRAFVEVFWTDFGQVWPTRSRPNFGGG